MAWAICGLGERKNDFKKTFPQQSLFHTGGYYFAYFCDYAFGAVCTDRKNICDMLRKRFYIPYVTLCCYICSNNQAKADFIF